MELKKNAYIKNSFINNPVAQKIVKRKELEIMDWSQDEIDQVMQAEEIQQSAVPAIAPEQEQQLLEQPA